MPAIFLADKSTSLALLKPLIKDTLCTQLKLSDFGCFSFRVLISRGTGSQYQALQKVTDLVYFVEIKLVGQSAEKA